jgi:hypothetical protein
MDKVNSVIIIPGSERFVIYQNDSICIMKRIYNKYHMNYKTDDDKVEFANSLINHHITLVNKYIKK